MSLTRDEASLLLFLETAAVDHGGLLSSLLMNDQDHATVAKWKESGFVQFGRIAFSDIKDRKHNHWCVLGEEAWRVAHEERRARCERMMKRMNCERIGFKSGCASGSVVQSDGE